MACRGRNAHPHRLHPPQGWPPRPPLVGAARYVSGAGWQGAPRRAALGGSCQWRALFMCADCAACSCKSAGRLGGSLEERLAQQRVYRTACARRQSAGTPCRLIAAAGELVFGRSRMKLACAPQERAQRACRQLALLASEQPIGFMSLRACTVYGCTSPRLARAGHRRACSSIGCQQDMAVRMLHAHAGRGRQAVRLHLQLSGQGAALLGFGQRLMGWP